MAQAGVKTPAVDAMLFLPLVLLATTATGVFLDAYAHIVFACEVNGKQQRFAQLPSHLCVISFYDVGTLVGILFYAPTTV